MQKIKDNWEKLKKFFSCNFLKISKIVKSFSLIEKIVFSFISFVFLISTLLILNKINQLFLVEIPTYGSSFTEGIIGSPRFINPVLATSNTDKDLCILIYSGLLKATTDGELTPDLAESYEISEDGFVYTVKLKDDLFFHDGHPLTTTDIEFTIKATQNDVIKSPQRAGWDGVEVKKIDDKEIQFILTQPYSPFLENLTLGVLPEHIWEKISPEQFAFSQFNIEPIGSGPYKLNKVNKNSSGILEEYFLKAFDDYSLGKPYISKINIKLYQDEETLLEKYKKGEIGGLSSVSPEKINSFQKKEKSQILSTPLSRIFGVFFNQDESPVFTNKEVRTALNQAIDRDLIIEKVLNGYGVAVMGPIPPQSKYFFEMTEENSNLELAQNTLKQAGWKLNSDGIWEKTTREATASLSFSISTADTSELKTVAELLKSNWEELGAEVDLKIFETGDLNQNVIRPRKYETLLFGEVVGRDMDLFAFWHSSQRNDPGLNIAMYANITADNLLEKIRTLTNMDSKQEKLESFQKEIANDQPAIFLYSPKFIYIVPKQIKNIEMNQITIPAERFLNIREWYIETDKVWKFFL